MRVFSSFPILILALASCFVSVRTGKVRIDDGIPEWLAKEKPSATQVITRLGEPYVYEERNRRTTLVYLISVNRKLAVPVALVGNHLVTLGGWIGSADALILTYEGDVLVEAKIQKEGKTSAIFLG